MKIKPDLVIFRIKNPDHPVEHLFVELTLDQDGFVAEQGRMFTVFEGNQFNEMSFDQIIFAKKTAEGSRTVCSYSIGNEDGTAPQNVVELDYDTLEATVHHLLEVYLTEEVSYSQ